MSNECTLLVNSCDNYSDTWTPFFKLLSKYWPDCPYKIVLNTESLSFKYNDLNINTFSFYKEGKSVSWGRRVIRHLKKIETEFVLIVLDDFFIRANVDQARIEECISWMKWSAPQKCIQH